MSPGLENFNNRQQLTVMGLITSLCQNHLSGEKGYRMSSAQIIWGQPTENSANSIARSICLHSDMTLQIKMILYWSSNKRLSQFNKGPSSVGGKEQSWLAKVLSSRGLCFFGPNPLLELSCFLTFLAFTTFLCWLFFTLVFYLNSLTTLLRIFCWTYYWRYF